MALRSDLHPSSFQENNDFIKYIFMTQDKLNDWILAIRISKVYNTPNHRAREWERLLQVLLRHRCP
jgi:hypothetical protein